MRKIPTVFTCTECGYLVHRFVGDPPPDPPVCRVCAFIGAARSRMTPEEYERMRDAMRNPELPDYVKKDGTP